VGLLVSPLGGINVIIPGFVNRISIPPTLTAIPATSTTTSTPLPTRRPSASPTIRINPLVAKGCVHWSKVTHADVGKELCVFGIVRHVSDLCLDPEGTDFYCFNWAQTWFAHFSNEISSESSHFRLYSINASYPGINVGDCISLEGIVRSNGSNSFVFINPASPSVGGEVLIYSDGSVCIP